jgi:trimethylamine:corrinoid methyltransferase-like protein
MREECFFPELSNRKAYDEWKNEGEQTISQKANAKTRQVLENYQPESLDTDIDKELRNFLKKVEEREAKESK